MESNTFSHAQAIQEPRDFVSPPRENCVFVLSQLYLVFQNDLCSQMGTFRNKKNNTPTSVKLQTVHAHPAACTSQMHPSLLKKKLSAQFMAKFQN